MKIKLYINLFLWSMIQMFRVDIMYRTFKKYLLRNIFTTFKIYLPSDIFKKYILEIYLIKKHLFKYIWLVSYIHPQQILQKWYFPREIKKRKIVIENYSKIKCLHTCISLSCLKYKQCKHLLNPGKAIVPNSYLQHFSSNVCETQLNRVLKLDSTSMKHQSHYK